ncbi:MAG: tetratricopeptide repeat protein [Elusimicrobiota bacterium]|nr:MAG: tetratricopeptide repeat protein [Elusimicrobiota bacterium]
MLSESKSVRARLREARRAVEAGRPAAALPAFERALAADPDCAYGWFFRAGVRAVRGDLDGAEADLRALGRLPASTLVRYREFDAPSVKRYPGYLPALDALLARPRPPAWAYVLRAFALRESQRFSEAIASVERGAAAAPKDAGLRAILARVRFVNRFPKEGLSDLRAAVRLDPACGWIRAWLGEALRHRGEPGAALAELERAIALDPGYFRSFAWRGGIRSSQGRHAEAAADFDRALSVDWSYCWAYRGGGREADPNLSWVFNERMRARRALGDVEGGLEDLNRAHALNNRYVWIHAPAGPPPPSPRPRRN